MSHFLTMVLTFLLLYWLVRNGQRQSQQALAPDPKLTAMENEIQRLIRENQERQEKCDNAVQRLDALQKDLDDLVLESSLQAPDEEQAQFLNQHYHEELFDKYTDDSHV